MEELQKALVGSLQVHLSEALQRGLAQALPDLACSRQTFSALEARAAEFADKLLKQEAAARADRERLSAENLALRTESIFLRDRLQFIATCLDEFQTQHRPRAGNSAGVENLLRDCAVLAGKAQSGSEIGGSSKNVMPEVCRMHRPVSHVEVEQQASMAIECDMAMPFDPRPLGDALDSSRMGSNRGSDHIQRGKSHSHVSCYDHDADVGNKKRDQDHTARSSGCLQRERDGRIREEGQNVKEAASIEHKKTQKCSMSRSETGNKLSLARNRTTSSTAPAQNAGNSSSRRSSAAHSSSSSGGISSENRPLAASTAGQAGERRHKNGREDASEEGKGKRREGRGGAEKQQHHGKLSPHDIAAAAPHTGEREELVPLAERRIEHKRDAAQLPDAFGTTGGKDAANDVTRGNPSSDDYIEETCFPAESMCESPVLLPATRSRPIYDQPHENSSVVLPEGRRIPIDSKRVAVRQEREVLEKTDDEETDAEEATDGKRKGEVQGAMQQAHREKRENQAQICRNRDFGRSCSSNKDDYSVHRESKRVEEEGRKRQPEAYREPLVTDGHDDTAGSPLLQVKGNRKRTRDGKEESAMLKENCRGLSSRAFGYGGLQREDERDELSDERFASVSEEGDTRKTKIEDGVMREKTADCGHGILCPLDMAHEFSGRDSDDEVDAETNSEDTKTEMQAAMYRIQNLPQRAPDRVFGSRTTSRAFGDEVLRGGACEVLKAPDRVSGGGLLRSKTLGCTSGTGSVSMTRFASDYRAPDRVGGVRRFQTSPGKRSNMPQHDGGGRTSGDAISDSRSVARSSSRTDNRKPLQQMSRVSARANSVVRVKDDRQALKAFSCAQCDEFYATMSKSVGGSVDHVRKTCQHASRHRHQYTPPQTPEDYYKVGWQTTQEDE